MATYASEDTTKADPRLLNALYSSAKASAEMSASRINEYGSSISPALDKLYRNNYALSVKEAQGYAADLGVKYTPPEIISVAAVKNEVPGVTLASVTSTVQDKLQTVDGYGKELTHNLTAMANNVTSSIASAKNWLMSTKIPGLGSLTDIKNTATGLYNAGKAGYDELSNRAAELSDAINKPIQQVKGMSDQIMNDTMSKYNQLMASPVAKVIQSGGKDWPVVLGSSVPGINKLIDTYNRTLNEAGQSYDRLRNLPAELSMRLSIYKLANSYGMTDLADQIRKGDDQGNSQAYHAELITQFDIALSNGDLSIIRNMVTTLGVTTVLTRYPDAISRIIKAYRFPPNTTAADYPARKNELVQTLTMIDPNWLNNTAMGSGIGRLSIFYGASTSTKKAMGVDNQYNRLIMAAQHYTSYINMPLVTTVKQIYPLAPL